VIAALSDRDVLLAISPEALAAAAAYRAARSDLLGALTTCSSGRELVAVGNGADIARAAVLNVSRAVPVLGADGAYADAASG
jgi:2-phosphosulfolactate phosphatase